MLKCYALPGQAGFYSVLPLDYLLCCWLAGRVCRRGQDNHFRLLVRCKERPHPTTSPLEGISDLIDQLPLDACVELTRRLLTAIPSLPKGAARPRAVLKTVILFVAEYGSTP